MNQNILIKNHPTAKACGLSENRKTQEHFKCVKCGYENNADLNAAFNIANNFRASVNKPIVASSNA